MRAGSRSHSGWIPSSGASVPRLAPLTRLGVLATVAALGDGVQRETLMIMDVGGGAGNIIGPLLNALAARNTGFERQNGRCYRRRPGHGQRRTIDT